MPDPLHPHYDEIGVTFDGGFFYADGVPDNPPVPTPKRKTRMSSSPFNLNLSRLSREQFLSMVNTATDALDPAAPATPPIAGVSTEVAALKASAATATTKKAAWEAAKAALVTAKAEMDDAFDLAKDDTRAMASVIEGKAKGVVAVLSLSTLPLAGASVPSVIPAQISNLSVTASDMDGALDVSHDPEVNSTSYEREVTTTDPINGPWVRQPSTTSSHTSIPGLTSGQRAWVRVRGVGPKGSGPWSDPGTKIVP
jgi:hypothetical protein